MNPFIKHKILKDLPYELMVKPEKAAILRFVKRKRTRHNLLHYFLTGLGVVMLVLNLAILRFEPVNYLNLLVSSGFIVQGLWGVYQGKSITLDEDELDKLLS